MKKIHKSLRSEVVFLGFLTLLILIGGTSLLTITDRVAIPQSSQLAQVAVPSGATFAWTLDEGSGTTATDGSGNGNNGTLTNATWQTGSACKIGSCLSFSGTNSYVKGGTGTLGLSIAGDFSASLWFKRAANTAVGSRQYLIGRGGIAPFTMYFDEWNGLYIVTRTTNTNYVVSPSSFSLNTWYHAVFIKTGNNYQLYINGTLNTSGAFSTPGNLDLSSGNFFAGVEDAGGGTTGTRFLNGSLDQIRIYNRALTSTEVLNLFNETSGSPPPPTQTCGNTIIEGTETCDGTQLNAQSCTTQGFTGGTLSCNGSCTGFITSSCTNTVTDTTPPTVSLTAPTNGATVSNTITLSATASDASGVQSVAFLIDGTTAATDTTSPYSTTIDTNSYSNSSHTITARATDTSGNTANSVVTITISNTVVTIPGGCNDGIDNDGDGKTDYPSDEGCASASDSDEHVGLGFVPSTTTGTLTSSNSCSASCSAVFAETCPASSCTGTELTGGTCAGGSHAGNACLLKLGGGIYPNNAWSFTQTGKTIRNVWYDGYVELKGGSSNYSCVRLSGRQISIQGSNTTFSCFDAGGDHTLGQGSGSGHILKVESGVKNVVFQDGLVHDSFLRGVDRNPPTSYSIANNGILFAGNNSGAVHRVEFRYTDGMNVNPSTGNTIELDNNWFSDGIMFQGNPADTTDSGTHLEFLANEANAGGTVNFHDNRLLMTPDVDGGGTGADHTGWSGAFKIQHNNGIGTALWNVYNNLFDKTGSKSVALATIPYTFSISSHDAGACPGPVNFYNNAFPKGSSGYFDITSGSTANACGFCANGATQVYGNTDLTGAAVSGPGGNCGGSGGGGSTVSSFTLNTSIEGSTPASRTFTLTINTPGSGTPLTTKTITPASSSLLISGLSLASGSYDLYLSTPGYLRRKLTSTLSDGGSVTMTVLIAGDLNNDGVINSPDWSLMNGQWGTANTQSDVNRDGVVNSIDFYYLNKNWMLAGA